MMAMVIPRERNKRLGTEAETDLCCSGFAYVRLHALREKPLLLLKTTVQSVKENAMTL